MTWPTLPSRAAYLALKNGRRRNALSLAVLRDLKSQLVHHNTSPTTGELRLLPPFQPGILDHLERASQRQQDDAQLTSQYRWLVNGQAWREERQGLPSVIVLRSDGPVFSSGHDLGELRSLSHDDVKETFALCAEVMRLIRRSPSPVIAVVQGLATAAGCQLALTADMTVACASTKFQLPGASIGLPCTSPSTAVSRRLGAPFTYRMLALAEPVRADQLPGAAVETVPDEAALEQRVDELVTKLSIESGAQSQALGKWAFWTQLGIRGDESGGDGYEEAVSWAGRAMALHSRCDDAKEGMAAFVEKRKPAFNT